MAIKTIFLDMDGVLSDFNGGVGKKFGVDTSKQCTWQFDYQALFGMSANKFWGSLDEDFWANLDKLPWADTLIEMLEPYEPCLLTAPSRSTASGKQRWIQRHLPKYFYGQRYLIGPGKKHCAHPGAVLIDDREKNVREFREHDGQAILFPAPWNSLRYMAHDPLPIVFGSLTKIIIGAV